MHAESVSAQLHRLNWLLRARVVEAKLHDLKRAIKAGFDPNEPRVPAGSGRTSGRWTDGGGGSGGGTQLAQNAPRSRGGSGQLRLRNGRLVETTPAQEARHAAAGAEAALAIRRVQEIDPGWKPPPSMRSDTIEGDIAAAEGETREARERLFELAKQPAENLIDACRREQGMDLLGEPNWSRAQNTVALCKTDGVPFVGVNSGVFTYGKADQSAAERLRATLLEAYPDLMSTGNIGRTPNDALFHAETTCLLRAARANDGNLAGHTVEIHVDREMCPSCEKVLPYVGLELGNPTVTFIDPSGRVRIMRDGYWIK